MKIYSKGKMLEVGGANNIYSTEEQVVGRWIDGRPIYQRTWKNIGSVDLSESIAHEITLPDFTIDMEIHEYSGRLIRTDGLKITIPGVITLCVNQNNKVVMLGVAFVGVYNIENLTIQYTKASDQVATEPAITVNIPQNLTVNASASSANTVLNSLVE